MISNEDASSGLSVLPEQAPRRRGVRATALTAAVLLVGTAGVAAAFFRSTTSDRNPATIIPANAFGVATIHLDFPGGQDDAISHILGLFPGLKLPDGGSLTDRVMRAITKDSTPPVDYDKDIKPWLGDSATVAGWLDNGKPTMEVVLESTNDDAARAHLPAIMSGDGHFEVHDGWAVLGNSQAEIDDALKAASTSALANTGTYADDVNALPSNELVSGWLDGSGAVKALQGALGGAGGLSMFGALGAGSLDSALKDRLALGLHVADNVVQMDFRDVGSTKPALPLSSSSLMTQLPSGTIGAFELGDPAALLKAITPAIKIFGSFVGSSEVCSGSGFAVAPAIPPSVLMRQLQAAIPPGTPHRKAEIRRLFRQTRMAQARAGAQSSTQSGGTCTSTPPVDPLAQIQKALGISFPDDLETILGDQAVVAFGGLELGGLPDVAIRSHPTDLSSAQSLAQQMTSHLASTTPLHLSTTTAGDDLVLATSPSYGAEVGKAGTFGDVAQVQQALDGLPAQISVAFYLDLARVWGLAGADVPNDVKHLKAIGLWAGRSGDVSTVQLRVVFG